MTIFLFKPALLCGVCPFVVFSFPFGETASPTLQIMYVDGLNLNSRESTNGKSRGWAHEALSQSEARQEADCTLKEDNLQ